MAQVKTAVSIDETLYSAVEEAAAELQLTRSGLYALALREFLERRRGQQLTERFNAVYDGTIDPHDQTMMRGMRERQRRMTADDEW